MTDIDWSKAPEGATHYMPETESSHAVWVMVSGNTHLAWLASGDSSWEIDRSLEEDREYLIPRPAPQWNGEGLPPAGTRLECQYAVEGFTTWHAGECIAVGTSPEGEVICVIKAGETIACYLPGSRMRPIKTPAQIVAEEREAAVRELAGAIMGHAIGCRLPMSESGAERLADHLMMDGYTKTKGEDQ